MFNQQCKIDDNHTCDKLSQYKNYAYCILSSMLKRKITFSEEHWNFFPSEKDSRDEENGYFSLLLFSIILSFLN
jgi:hypothetical protein